MADNENKSGEQPTDKIKMISLNKKNKKQFLEKITIALENKFKTTVDNLPENYGYQNPWSLLSLIENEKIDTYQLLYVNDKFWSGSGGIIRSFNGEHIYQAAFRGFTYADGRHKGLGIKSYTHMYNTKFQIKRAKENKCSKVIMSFNDYNYKLFLLTQKYSLPRVFPENTFVPSKNMVIFNEVPQWLLTMDISR
jgi:hypothetical protein